MNNVSDQPKTATPERQATTTELASREQWLADMRTAYQKAVNSGGLIAGYSFLLAQDITLYKANGDVDPDYQAIVGDDWMPS